VARWADTSIPHTDTPQALASSSHRTLSLDTWTQSVCRRHTEQTRTQSIFWHYARTLQSNSRTLLCLETWSCPRTDTTHKHLNAVHISTLCSADTWTLSTYRHYAKKPYRHTDAMQRYLSLVHLQTQKKDSWIQSIYRCYAKIIESGPYTDTMLRHLNPIHMQTLCSDTWIRSIYRYYAKTLESISHTGCMPRHLNPVHILTMWSYNDLLILF